MRAKTLFDQHEKFEAAQAKKAARQAAKAERAQKWAVELEQRRKRQEARDRVRDQRQQAMLDATDADRWSRSG